MVGRVVSRVTSAGFTLLELMVTIAIVAILAAFAIPSFTTMVANSRLGGAANTLQAALLKARSEALKRNCSMIVQPRTGGWVKGWQVVSDAGCPDDVPDLIQDDTVRGIVQVTTTPSSLASLTYLSSGRFTVGTSERRFQIADPEGAGDYRCVRIDTNGMPKVGRKGRDEWCTDWGTPS